MSHVKPAHVGHFQFCVRPVPYVPHIWRMLRPCMWAPLLLQDTERVQSAQAVSMVVAANNEVECMMCVLRPHCTCWESLVGEARGSKHSNASSLFISDIFWHGTICAYRQLVSDRVSHTFMGYMYAHYVLYITVFTSCPHYDYLHVERQSDEIGK